MDIVISYTSTEPIYRQIYHAIRGDIMSGVLASGQALPSIRNVAVELGISVITVKKAWDELEHDGLIVSVAGKGCFVAGLKDKELDTKKLTMLKERIGADINHYRTYGYSDRELMGLIKECFEE